MKKTEIDSLLEALRCCNINWIVVFPSTGLDVVYAYYQEKNRCLYTTREEEAVAIASGLTIGGDRPLVLMQQSGVGNALNAVFTLADAYDVFFPILVCDRSELDPNPVQRVSSKSTKQVLEPLGCSWVDWSEPNAIEKFRSCLERRSRWIICPN
ncbi:hypothetical protein [Scytonema sp. PCC 10023]|uniref:hypothetical protein n=1 Tax=Scytonema sp. PCC 10023 TaxID=1680591 RepID=UPI0039C662CF